MGKGLGSEPLDDDELKQPSARPSKDERSRVVGVKNRTRIRRGPRVMYRPTRQNENADLLPRFGTSKSPVFFTAI